MDSEKKDLASKVFDWELSGPCHDATDLFETFSNNSQNFYFSDAGQIIESLELKNFCLVKNATEEQIWREK